MVAVLATIIVLSVSLTAWAQSPSSIAGRTLQLAVTSGTSPFASSGSYRMLPSATDARYAIVPLSGNIFASDGTYSYTKTGTTTARLAINDSGAGPLEAACTFSSPNAGTYVLTSTLFPGGRQTGTFVMFAGASPKSIAGRTLTVTVTSGESPFADSGGYQFIPSPTGNTYSVLGFGGIPNSSGTYTYSKNSPTTGLIIFTDSEVGTGLSQQLSFDSATSGSAHLRLVGSSGYQTALFSMSAASSPPTITAQPQAQTALPGAIVSFSVSATGTSPLHYQWRFNGLNIVGANAPTLTLNRVQSEDAGAYSVIVSNSDGTATSANAALVIVQLPAILVHPVGAIARAGTNITLSVTATGSPPLTFQWRFNGTAISGGTEPTYTLSNVQPDQSGAYSVRVSNAAGSATSSEASIVIWKTAAFQPILSQPSGPATNIHLRLSQLEAGALYRVQFSPNFARWFELTNLIAATTVSDATHPTSTNLPRMFYRVFSP